VNTKVHGVEVDLHVPAANLAIEIDGPGHARPRTRNEDATRDAVLRDAGVTVLRIPSGHG
jgi:very-short-patch-repair endonuclease